jgi:hypothetical protein
MPATWILAYAFLAHRVISPSSNCLFSRWSALYSILLLVERCWTQTEQKTCSSLLKQPGFSTRVWSLIIPACFKNLFKNRSHEKEFIRTNDWIGHVYFLTANVNAQSVQGTVASFEGGTSFIAIMAPVSKTSDKAALANIRAHNVAIYNHFIRNFRDAADIIPGNAGGKMFIYWKQVKSVKG